MIIVEAIYNIVSATVYFLVCLALGYWSGMLQRMGLWQFLTFGLVNLIIAELTYPFVRPHIARLLGVKGGAV